VGRADRRAAAGEKGRAAMMKVRTTPRLTALVLLCLAGSPFAATAAVEVTHRSPELLAGRDPALGAEFSARAQGGVVTVEVGLRGGKRVLARIDDAGGGVFVRSVATSRDDAEVPAALEQADLLTLRALHRTVGPLPHRVGDALGSLLALLDEVPPGLVLDVDTARAPGAKDRAAAAEAAAASGIRSLCGVARTTGTYTLDGGRRVSARVAVGPATTPRTSASAAAAAAAGARRWRASRTPTRCSASPGIASTTTFA
jgi:hypothetical protein